MKCNCSCFNISDTAKYIDLYNTNLALEVVRGEEYLFILHLITDVDTASFSSTYFNGDFIKADDGKWVLMMGKSESAKLELGIWPYTVKANGYYLYSGVMNVIDSESSSESESNESSEINKLMSNRHMFEFKSDYTVSKDDDHIYVTYPFTKKNQDVFDDLIADLTSATEDIRLQSLRFALCKFEDYNIVPYSITQDINYDESKISAEYYYVDDYVKGCDHILFEFTHDNLVVSMRTSDDYYENGGSEETFAKSISNLLQEYRFGEFTLIEKKTDAENTLTYTGGDGISINKAGVISADFSGLATDDDITKLESSINETNDKFDSYAPKIHNHNIDDVSGLQRKISDVESSINNINTKLNSCALKTHTHEISDVNGLQAALDKASSTGGSSSGTSSPLKSETFVISNFSSTLTDEQSSVVSKAVACYKNHTLKIVSMLCGAISSDNNIMWSTSNVSVIGYEESSMSFTSTTYNPTLKDFYAFGITKTSASMIDLKQNDMTKTLSGASIFLKICYEE